jgi:hypothetical protein
MSRSLSAAVVAVLALVWFDVGSTSAQVQKVNVCHREGNGTYHLITVASQAVPAHLNHGDALPGGLVPDQSGFKFDDTCQIVQASVCPCDLSIGRLVELKVLPANSSCTVYSNGTGAVIQGLDKQTGEPYEMGIRFTTCYAFVGSLTAEKRECSPDEASDCVEDLITLAKLLEISCVQK